eukprot:116001-Ditylum_brightwellii.AAC.1
MAGTGDLDTLRFLRALRWRCDGDVRYGSHMAFGSAIGLLFLGGGRCTLGQDPEDIAALLIAFFPRFPATTSDNQYHLQALRHCYALAVKCSELVAIDIDTREEVFVPIEIDFGHTMKETSQLTAPCLLLNRDDMTQMRIVSERYYQVNLDMAQQSTPGSQLRLFVKKKSGHLTYLQDPHALRSLLVQTGGSGGGSTLDLIKSFTEDNVVLAYAKYLCDSDNEILKKNARSFIPKQNTGGIGFTIEEFCTDILHECLTQEKPDAIPMYLSLRNSLVSIDREKRAIGN